jgi:hypothetical protein
VNLRRLAAALALVAVALLVVAEFSTVFEVTVGTLQVVKRSSSAGANHGHALLLVALAAVALTALGLRGPARAAGAGLALLGVAALVVALAIDLPDTRARGTLPESLAYENAAARAGPALGLEIAGGVLLLAAGAALTAAAGGRRA